VLLRLRYSLMCRPNWTESINAIGERRIPLLFKTCIATRWTKRSNVVGMPSLRTPPSGLGISIHFSGFGLQVPTRSWSRITRSSGSSGSSSTVLPSIPALPLLVLTCYIADFRFCHSPRDKGRNLDKPCKGGASCLASLFSASPLQGSWNLSSQPGARALGYSALPLRGCE
jgi:hypothetical protein